jgi:hypothetical protein
MNIWVHAETWGKFFPCPSCGAKPGKRCHIIGDASRLVHYNHVPRTKPIWDAWNEGFRAATQEQRTQAVAS